MIFRLLLSSTTGQVKKGKAHSLAGNALFVVNKQVNAEAHMALIENNMCILRWGKDRSFQPHLRESLRAFRRLELHVPVKEYGFSWSSKKHKLAVFLGKFLQHFIDGHKFGGSTVPLSLLINFEAGFSWNPGMCTRVHFAGYPGYATDNETFVTLYFKMQLLHFINCMRIKLRQELPNAVVTSNVDMDLRDISGRRISPTEVKFRNSGKLLCGTVTGQSDYKTTKVSYILYDNNDEI